MRFGRRVAGKAGSIVLTAAIVASLLGISHSEASGLKFHVPDFKKEFWTGSKKASKAGVSSVSFSTDFFDDHIYTREIFLARQKKISGGGFKFNYEMFVYYNNNNNLVTIHSTTTAKDTFMINREPNIKFFLNRNRISKVEGIISPGTYALLLIAKKETVVSKALFRYIVREFGFTEEMTAEG